MSIELPEGTAAYSNSAPPPNNRQLLTVFGLFLVGLIGSIALALWLASSLVWLIPTSVERQLGRVIVPIYEAQAEPSAAQTALNQLLDRLEAQLPPEQKEERDYQVFYVPEDTVNALAIPGDRIIIYRGLLAEVESENELMMILGHELGHFANRDHLRGLTRQVMVRLVLAAALGDAGAAGAIATNSASAITSAQFSQSQEKQADEIGLTLLEQTYGHAAGATDFFSRLIKKDLPAGLAILSSHPPSKARVDNIERAIKKENYLVKEKSKLPSALAIKTS